MEKSVDVCMVKKEPLDTVHELQAAHEEEVSNILKTSRVRIPVLSKRNEFFCPTVKKCRITLEDRRDHKSLLRDLVSLNMKLETTKKHLLECDKLHPIYTRDGREEETHWCVC